MKSTHRYKLLLPFMITILNMLLIWLQWVLAAAHRTFITARGSLAVVHGLSCPMAFEILIPWPGIEPEPLHGSADS